jgi:hypothetical protein
LGSTQESSCLGLVKTIQHGWRYIRVPKDDLPAACFAVIEVGDTIVQGNLISGKSRLPVLDANFVGNITNDLN